MSPAQTTGTTLTPVEDEEELLEGEEPFVDDEPDEVSPAFIPGSSQSLEDIHDALLASLGLPAIVPDPRPTIIPPTPAPAAPVLTPSLPPATVATAPADLAAGALPAAGGVDIPPPPPAFPAAPDVKGTNIVDPVTPPLAPGEVRAAKALGAVGAPGQTLGSATAPTIATPDAPIPGAAANQPSINAGGLTGSGRKRGSF